MVCLRCKIAVKSTIEKIGLNPIVIELGKVEIEGNISTEQWFQLDNELKKYGLELMNNNNCILVEKIKNCIVELVHYSDAPRKINLSIYLSEKLNYNYTYLANLFSKVQGTTIEKFFISHKIERVKELLAYFELNLTEISYQMNYSSVAHLSKQFKQITGLTASDFKHIKYQRLNSLENIN